MSSASIRYFDSCSSSSSSLVFGRRALGTMPPIRGVATDPAAVFLSRVAPVARVGGMPVGFSVGIALDGVVASAADGAVAGPDSADEAEEGVDGVDADVVGAAEDVVPGVVGSVAAGAPAVVAVGVADSVSSMGATGSVGALVLVDPAVPVGSSIGAGAARPAVGVGRG